MSLKTINDEYLSAIGAAIRSKNGTEETYKPSEMAAAISAITGGGSGDFEIPAITGDCSYRFYNGGWQWFINNFENKIQTQDIYNCSYMFAYGGTGLERIPFEINCSEAANTTFSYMFQNCFYLKEISSINNTSPGNMQYMFENCRFLRHLPEGFSNNWRWDYFHKNQSSAQYMFNCCYSLRSIPSSFLSNLYSATTSSYSGIYRYLFSNCYTLDEVRDLGVCTGTLTTNHFTYLVDYCHRLKSFTFATNEDGTPKTVNWKSQSINLSNGVGYWNAVGTTTNTLTIDYNSGITIDKYVTDDASYQALKNDPDWFSGSMEYSRYNHDSAVETINSLPNASAYLATAGGTNTISFRGAAGSATDGGAINTLTDAEIAVAAAKGWTVSFV